MNEKLYYSGFNTKLGSFDICHQGKFYTVECGFVFLANNLLVAIWLNDQSPLHLGRADFICSVFVDNLRTFPYSKDLPKDLPEDLLTIIEYQARRFDKLKAFL